jgi:hypothetical protein
MAADHMATLAATLTRLFAEKTLVARRCQVAPYHQVAEGVTLGFEPSARVELETRPKDDFTRSPDACLVTQVVHYRGPSRWLTVEAELDRSELAGARRFQVGLYARPDRDVTCRVVLRIPTGGEDNKDFTDIALCELVLAVEGRSAHGQGTLEEPVPGEAASRPPKLLVFFDPTADLHLVLDYLTAYFA